MASWRRVTGGRWRVAGSALLAALGACMACVVPLRAQSQVSARMTVALRIPCLFLVQDEVTGSGTVHEGGWARSEGAVRLYVSGNARWRLLAQARAGADLSLRVGAVAGGVQAASAADGFVSLGAGQVEVAAGARGMRLPLSVDYRWRDSAAPGQVVYTAVAE